MPSLDGREGFGHSTSVMITPLLSLAARIGAESARPGGLRILLFHGVREAERPAFESIIAEAASRGHLTTPAEAAAMLTDRAPAEVSTRVLISFDDGFASNAAIAAPILDRYHAKALFFVCPGLLDKSGDEQRSAVATGIFDGRLRGSDLGPTSELMTWSDLDGLAKKGHVIGSHTLHHRRLTTLSTAEMEDEIGGSADRIGRHLGAKPAWFAYPFGDIGSINLEGLQMAARYHSFCRSGVRGINHRGASSLALRTQSIDLSRSRAWHVLAAEGGFDWRYAEARLRLDALALAAASAS